MGIVRTIFKNIAVVFSSTMIMMALSIIFTIMITRYLGTSAYGLYVYAVSLCAIFVNLSDLGTTQIAIREVAKNRTEIKRYLTSIIVYKAVVSLCVLISLYVLINILRSDPKEQLILYFFSFGAIFLIMASAFRWSFYAFQKLEYDSLLNISQSLLSLIAIIWVIYSRLGLFEYSVLYMLIYLVIFVLSVLLAMTKISRIEWHLDIGLLKNILRSSIPLGIIAIAAAVYSNVDKVILSSFKGDSETGLYGAAYKLMYYVRVVLIMYAPIIFPALSELSITSFEHKFKKLLDKSLYSMIAISIGITIGTNVLARPIIMLFFGDRFTGSEISLMILMWALPFTVIYGFLGYAMISVGRQTQFMVANLAGLIVNVALNFMLIPQYGLIGASISVLFTESMIAAITLYYSPRDLHFNISAEKLLRIFVAAAAMGALTYLLRGLNIFALIAVSSLAYFIALVMMRVVTREDWELFKKAIFDRPREAV